MINLICEGFMPFHQFQSCSRAQSADTWKVALAYWFASGRHGLLVKDELIIIGNLHVLPQSLQMLI